MIMVADTDRPDTHVESPNGTVEVERRVEPRERASHVVVAAMADALNCERMEVPPLHDTVDPEALDDLFGPRYDGTPRAGGRVEFTHLDCDVVVERERVRVFCD